MPIYEYLCHACGKKTELLQRMGADPITTCPECGGEVRKLISSPAVQFKGTGWYVTDYGKKGSAGAGGKSGDGGKSGESGASGESSKSGESGKSGGESKAAEKSSSESSGASSGTSETKAAKASGSD
jgi:putative FmdB family regulatory protein